MDSRLHGFASECRAMSATASGTLHLIDAKTKALLKKSVPADLFTLPLTRSDDKRRPSGCYNRRLVRRIFVIRRVTFFTLQRSEALVQKPAARRNAALIRSCHPGPSF